MALLELQHLAAEHCSLKLRVRPQSPVAGFCGVKYAFVGVSSLPCGGMKDIAACHCTANVGSCLMPEPCRVLDWHLGHEPNHRAVASDMGSLSHMYTTCSDLAGAGGLLGKCMRAKFARTQRSVDALLLAGCACAAIR